MLLRLFSSGGEWGRLSRSSLQASRCTGFSCCGTWLQGGWASIVTSQGSVVAAPGLQSTGSVFVAHMPSCSKACGIFLHQGSNACSLPWQVDSYPLHHQGSPVLNDESHTTGHTSLKVVSSSASVPQKPHTASERHSAGQDSVRSEK